MRRRRGRGSGDPTAGLARIATRTAVGLCRRSTGGTVVGLALLSGVAAAGSGPWVVGEDGLTLYLGSEAQRIGNLAIQVDEGERDILPVAQGVSKVGAKGIVTAGVGNRGELEANVP